MNFKLTGAVAATILAISGLTACGGSDSSSSSGDYCGDLKSAQSNLSNIGSLDNVTPDKFNAVLDAVKKIADGIWEITLDNVVVDNIGQEVSAQFANVQIGPGGANFMPSGTGVTVTVMVVAALTAPSPSETPARTVRTRVEGLSELFQ